MTLQAVELGAFRSALGCLQLGAAGGALSTGYEVTVSIGDIEFLDNHVFGQFGQGGAIFVSHLGVISGDRCTFTNNTAEFGGAVATLDAQVGTKDSAFNGNYATQYDGGAVYAVSTMWSSSVNLSSCNLTDNR
jgi:predicted outer membrane repeat protein